MSQSVTVVFLPPWTDEQECYRVEPHGGLSNDQLAVFVDGTWIYADVEPSMKHVAIGQPIVRVTDDEWQW